MRRYPKGVFWSIIKLRKMMSEEGLNEWLRYLKAMNIKHYDLLDSVGGIRDSEN